MPGPFEQPEAPSFDKLTTSLEKGARARQILQLGVGEDLDKRRDAILRQAENELRSGNLTPDRAMMYVCCANGLRAYKEELERDIVRAQQAADELHAEEKESVKKEA